MSQNIYWVPVSKKRACLPTMAPSNFRSTLERVFGEFPVMLTDKDTEKLEALRDGIVHDTASYQRLLDAIVTHGTIEVSAE